MRCCFACKASRKCRAATFALTAARLRALRARCGRRLARGCAGLVGCECHCHAFRHGRLGGRALRGLAQGWSKFSAQRDALLRAGLPPWSLSLQFSSRRFSRAIDLPTIALQPISLRPIFFEATFFRTCFLRAWFPRGYFLRAPAFSALTFFAAAFLRDWIVLIEGSSPWWSVALTRMKCIRASGACAAQ